MKRAAELIELSRRDFCGLACLGIALAGCSSGLDAIGTGPLGAGGDDTTADANPGELVDAGHTVTDGGVNQVACTATTIDVGAASTFLLDKPVYVSSGRFFVVRDASGLYAVSAKCTHEGVVMAVSGTRYRCPRHGALFTYDGTIVSGPVTSALVHFSMCNLANGHLAVETTLTVSRSQRLVA